jgi:hypothetical protein
MTDSSSSPAPASDRAGLWQRLRGRFGTPGLVLLGVMLTLLISAVAYTVEGEKPWGRTVQRRLAKQEKLQRKEYAIIGSWWAAAVNAGMLALLLGTAGKWMPRPSSPSFSSSSSTPSDTPPAPSPSPSTSPTPEPSTATAPPDILRGVLRPIAYLLLILALAVGAWERWPKMHHSLWNDEEYAVRKFAHGAWEQEKKKPTANGAETATPGEWKFEPVTWVDTLWEARNGNNHVLNSLTMRLSLDAWRAMTGAPRDAFAEWVVRLPSYIAALITILMIFFLGKELGSPLAGLGGAWLLALHPWHIRYSAEARGYSMMICFLALSLYGLLLALRTNKLRWWLLFGVGEALYMLSFPGAVMVAAFVNLFVLVELICRGGWQKVGTLIAMNLLGAVIVLQLMLPVIPQMLIFLKEPQPNYVTDVWQWYRDLGSVLVFGWPYENFFPETHRGTDWLHENQHLFFTGTVAPIVLLLLAVVALASATMRSMASRLVITAPVVAGVVICLMNVQPGKPMTVWYLLYVLIPGVLALPLLLQEAAQLVKWKWTSLVAMLWLVLRFDTATAHSREVVRNADRQPVREVVQLIRSQSADAMTATFGVSDRQSAIYDPKVRILESAADLERVIAESQAAGKALYVFYCSDQHSKPRVPEVYARVVESASGEFERVGVLPGTEELFSYRVYRRR